MDGRDAAEFSGGKEDWARAAAEAERCAAFVPDVEEELVVAEGRSCYDCRYRRWSATSFTCHGPANAVAPSVSAHPAVAKRP
ncbi:hypothetical protein [Geomesophilobacter sediminis]|uniref:Uncharacterized protein n=1 Tax=Geomesophilobacter sediminis TaxID=2798584 RepID=A0A8J7M0I0_9BACT|nr:hypothetical protein [Geomesophilobacter sediminis]MBJ6725292.1 hypothetical protein [Geomesophilobacter sediminis]